MGSISKFYFEKAKFDKNIGEHGSVVLDDNLIFVLSEQPRVTICYPYDSNADDDYFRGEFYAPAYKIDDNEKEKEYEIAWDIRKDYNPEFDGENAACDWNDPADVTCVAPDFITYRKKTNIR